MADRLLVVCGLLLWVSPALLLLVQRIREDRRREREYAAAWARFAQWKAVHGPREDAFWRKIMPEVPRA